MSEYKTETPTTRITKSFLSWVQQAVDTGVPVIIRNGDKEELSRPLKSIASAYKILGLSDATIIDLARSGESAAKLNKAQREHETSERIAQLQQDYQANWQRFREARQELSEEYGISEEGMLSIIRELGKLPNK